MICNGVIDAQKEFAERRYRADAGRNFDRIKHDVMDRHGVNIECCRETYFTAAEGIFILVGDLLVDTLSKPPRIEPWTDAKKWISERPV
jgi:hypothetical protein